MILEMITAISIIFGGNSYHIDRNEGYDENNHIQGIEATIGNYKYNARFFNNSFSDPARTIGLSREWKLSEHVGFGYQAGVVDGYHTNDYKPFPFIAPQFTFHYNRLEMDFSCIPSACMYQFKWKFD